MSVFDAISLFLTNRPRQGHQGGGHSYALCRQKGGTRKEGQARGSSNPETSGCKTWERVPHAVYREVRQETGLREDLARKLEEDKTIIKIY